MSEHSIAIEFDIAPSLSHQSAHSSMFYEVSFGGVMMLALFSKKHTRQRAGQSKEPKLSTHYLIKQEVSVLLFIIIIQWRP
jgi:hypothetical protein